MHSQMSTQASGQYTVSAFKQQSSTQSTQSAQSTSSGSYGGYGKVTTVPGRSNVKSGELPAPLKSVAEYQMKPRNEMFKQLGQSMHETSNANTAHAKDLVTFSQLARNMHTKVGELIQDNDQARAIDKEALTSLKKNCEELTTELDKYQGDRLSIDEKLRSATMAINCLSAEKGEMQEQLNKACESLNLLQQESELVFQKLGISTNEVNKLTSENNQLKFDSKRVINGYSDAIKDLKVTEQELASANQTINILRQQNTQGEKDLESSNRVNGGLTRSLGNLTEKWNATKIASEKDGVIITDLKCQVTSLEYNLKEAVVLKTNLESQLDEKVNQLNDAGKQIDELVQQIADLNTRYEQAQGNAQHFELSWTNDHVSLQKAKVLVMDLKNELDMKGEQLQCAKSNKGSAEAEINSLKLELSNAREIICDVNKELIATNQKVEAKEVELLSLQHKLLSLLHKLSEAEQKGRDLEEKLNKKERTIKLMDERMDLLRSNLQRVNIKVKDKEQLETQVSTLVDSLNAEKQEKIILSTELLNVQKDVAALKAQCRESQDMIDTKDAEIQGQRSDILNKEGLLRDFQNTSEEAMQKAQEIETDLMQSDSKLEKANQMNAELRNILDQVLVIVNGMSIDEQKEKLDQLKGLLQNFQAGSTSDAQGFDCRSEDGLQSLTSVPGGNSPMPALAQTTVSQGYGMDLTSDEERKQHEITLKAFGQHQGSPQPQQRTIDSRVNSFLDGTNDLSIPNSANMDRRDLDERFESIMKRGDSSS